MTDPIDDDLQKLLRRLGSDDPFDRQEAVESLRSLDAAKLADLARHPITMVRKGVADLLAGRTEPELQAAALVLARDAEYDVRHALAQALGRTEDWSPSDDVLIALAKDQAEDVSMPAIRRMAGRPGCVETLLKIGRDDDASWNTQREANRLIAQFEDASLAVGATLETIASTGIEPIARECAVHLEKRFETAPFEGGSLGTSPTITKAAATIRGWSDTETPLLEGLLDRMVPPVADAKALGGFGRDLTAEARNGVLLRAFQSSDALEALERAIFGDDGRSVVLLGPNGVGKTGLVSELCHRLIARDGAPWTVLRVTPSELLVGTKYLGEWQTKVKQLIDLSCRPQRVLLFIPNVTELTEVGQSSDNELMSVATMLGPHVESGNITIIGESTPDSWARGTARDSSWSRLFQSVDVRAADRATTAEILKLVAAEAEADVTSSAIDVTLDVADVYLGETALPGRAVDLFRRMLASGEEGETFERSHVLRTLEEATGVPPDFLDDSIPLNLDTVRAFFEARVMGQPRALDQMLDLVTLVKAGLDAPNKPSGVLLFVGPTGVGKTELSRSLAELLFGDPQRLVRFDMSEYASYESYERLIGTPARAGTLTGAVRREPFSVVLLDEIEKAHRNVFDLCLQIFDAGRLTDGSGRTVSFTKSIVIMTSNLGAAVRTDAGIGFDGSTPPPPTAEEIGKALSNFFRPEFLGRVDQVVTFNALSAETADKIARREARSMLGRSGLTRRRVSVDVDESVYAQVLREGYSPALGARPLKRAVETTLLMPIARLLASGEARPGSCVRLDVHGDQVRASVSQPDDDTDDANAAAGVEGVDASTPSSHSQAARLDEIFARTGSLRERATRIEERRSLLMAETLQPGFWDAGQAASFQLDEMHRLEHLLDELTRLETEVDITAENRNSKRAAQFIDRHTRALQRLELLFDADGALGDAFVRLTAVGAPAPELDGVERLARMYAAWARRDGMDAKVLDDRPAGPESDDTITLLIEGTGAFALLRAEAGLHRLQHIRSGTETVTSLVRVDVLPSDDRARTALGADLEVESRPLRGVTGRLVASLSTDVHMLHRPTLASLRAWSPLAAPDAARSLAGLLAALGSDRAETSFQVVRRYRFGRSPIVKDIRSGRTTGRVDRVFGGELYLVTDA